MTPLQSIRLKCLDCVCGSANEVKLCPSSDCPLYRFRLGKNPNITKRELTPARAAALEKARSARKTL